jgi:hypothetical protein
MSSSTSPALYGWLFALILTEQVALYGATAYIDGGSHNPWYAAQAIIGYAVVAMFLIKALSLAHGDIGGLNMIWNVFSTILAFAMGILFFAAPVGDARRWVGAALGIASLVLLSIK